MCISASFNFLPFQVNFNHVIFTIYYQLGNELCLNNCITQFDTKIICKEPCEYFWPAFKFWISHLKTHPVLSWLLSLTFHIWQSSHLHLVQNIPSRLLTKTNITVFQWNSKFILFFINYKQIYSKPAETQFHLSASLNMGLLTVPCSYFITIGHHIFKVVAASAHRLSLPTLSRWLNLCFVCW